MIIQPHQLRQCVTISNMHQCFLQKHVHCTCTYIHEYVHTCKMYIPSIVALIHSMRRKIYSSVSPCSSWRGRLGEDSSTWGSGYSSVRGRRRLLSLLLLFYINHKKPRYTIHPLQGHQYMPVHNTNIWTHYGTETFDASLMVHARFYACPQYLSLHSLQDLLNMPLEHSPALAVPQPTDRWISDLPQDHNTYFPF